MEYKGKKVAILGHGIEGKDAESYLKNAGAEVAVLDQKYDENYLDGLSAYDLIVRSPGVYRNLPQIAQAEINGVLISSPINIFFENCPGKIIGVTGTKGKGTTSSLIYNILKASGFDAYLAGNIGKPFLELLKDIKKDSWVILELSSFQLIDLKKSPHIGVVLNITSDHMDWHKDSDEYINAKKNIIKFQGPDDYALINADYDIPKSFEELGAGKKYYFSKNTKVNGSYVKDGEIIINTGEGEESIGFASKLLLRGVHNWENVTAAVLASRLSGASVTAIKKEVFSFKGLEHRLELVDEIGGIKFYNDSFATGPQPTIAAVKSFSEPTTLILGGSDKGLDYKDLAREIAGLTTVGSIILIGQIGSDIGSLITLAGYKGTISDMGRSSMIEIVKKAIENTPKGGVVLLSPAAASFDMFENYKDRGNQFKSAVEGLKNV